MHYYVHLNYVVSLMFPDVCDDLFHMGFINYITVI